MKVAYLSPLNPIRSGISDYSEELLPFLRRYCEVTLFSEDGLPLENLEIAHNFKLLGYTDFEQHASDFDHYIYQLGNSAYHETIYRLAMKYPGIIVLHDLNISSIISGLTFGKNELSEFLCAIQKNEGNRAFALSLINFLLKRKLPDPWKYHLNKEIICKSKAVIVHNEFMKQQVGLQDSRKLAQGCIRKVPHGVPNINEITSKLKLLSREELHIAPNAFVVASFGFIHRIKRIDKAIEAFKRIVDYQHDAQFIFVGQFHSKEEEVKIGTHIDNLGLKNNIIFTGFADTDKFYSYIAACDFCVNLRYPSSGETSGALLRLMSMGKPVAVSNYQQYQEYPDDCCLKINLGEREIDQLAETMLFILSNPDEGNRIGENARKYIETYHSLEYVSKEYADVLRVCSLK